MDQFSRMKKIISQENFEKIQNSHVAVFGLGGVGSYVVEALSRCGVKELTLIDKDVIDETNINRQIFALFSTIGQAKVDVAKERILNINPKAKVNIIKKFYSKENDIDLSGCDYIVDAIDTVSSKLDLAEKCQNLNIPIISSMGTGNKLDPTRFMISDIYKTSVCPLCKVMRRELKKRGIKNLKVVYSDEMPLKTSDAKENQDSNSHLKQTPGSISFVPGTAGLIIASEVVKDLMSR